MRCSAMTTAPSRTRWRTSADEASFCAAAAERRTVIRHAPCMGQPLSHQLRVRYAECDLQGVVFNAHYLGYFDTSLAAMWREGFGGYPAMIERGLDVVVAEAQLRFRAPARFDEELTLEMSLTRLGETSIASAP